MPASIRQRSFCWVLVGAIIAWSATVGACPFCTTPKPTLVERRETAAVVALAEVTGTEGASLVLRLDQVLKGGDRLPDAKRLVLPKELVGQTHGLLLLLGKADEARTILDWDVLEVDETSYAYFGQAPATRLPAQQRLVWFCRYLEHPDALLADDAYAEFGRAPYDEVAKLADQLPMAKLRDWLADDDVSPEHKGLYGLLAGLAANPSDRQANERLLRSIIDKPASDFRAGFDGVLGGYLLLAGETGLEQIEQLYLGNPRAARGDVLHAMTALRFYYEYGHGIPHARLAKALAGVLATPGLAAPTIVDLARWRAWDELPQIADLFGQKEYQDSATQRAIIGYLLVCPEAAAADKLAQIRRQSPQRVAEVEANLPLLGAGR